MPSYIVTQHIAAPADLVFEVATDFERTAKNINSIQRIELLTDGPIGIGTRFNETRVVAGMTETVELEVVDFQPPRHFKLQCHSHGSQYEANFRLIPDIWGTTLRLEVNGEPISLAAKLMMPLALLMSGPIKKATQSHLEELRELVEARAKETTLAE